MKSLLTNVDGILAQGLWALYRALKSHHEVVVVAPERERSAVGHGITLHKPLRVHKVDINGESGWTVNGTPADCVKIAIVELLDGRPDMVISGINPGANVGVNLNYSGTVAAAKEAALYHVPAMAVSIQSADDPSFDRAAHYIAGLARLVKSRGLPPGVFLNINIPNLVPNQALEIKITHQGSDLYDEYFEKRRDPRNRVYYWQGFETLPTYSHSDADGAALAAGYISITPVQCDLTDYTMAEKMRSWNFEFR
jgi:5'-nucleotidase